MPLLLIRNDITKLNVDAVVNPANEKLLEGSGASRAIYKAAGEAALAEACEEIGHCEVGKAVITQGFKLPARYVIHAVGPVWHGGRRGEQELLYGAYWESMALAEKYELESIDFPLLSSGNYGYPKEKALNTAIRAISDFLMEKELLVYLVIYDPESVVVSKKLFASLAEYIDDNYVEENDEYYPENRRGVPMNQMMIAGEAVKSAEAPEGLERLLERREETFSRMLLRLIDERGLKDSYVYKRANIDRRHFSKIRNDDFYSPNKRTVFAFAVALELSLDETIDLLGKAGYAFSNCVKEDLIIRYFIERGIYDVFEINNMLFIYGQPILGE